MPEQNPPSSEKPIFLAPEDTSTPHDDPYRCVEWWRQLLVGPLFVYFIQDGEAGPVKIGQALNPKSRLETLQCGNPRELNLRAVVLATEAAEEQLHTAWAPERIRGEWFAAQDEIIGRAQRTQRRQVERAEQLNPRRVQPAAYRIASMFSDIRPARLQSRGAA